MANPVHLRGRVNNHQCCAKNFAHPVPPVGSTSAKAKTKGANKEQIIYNTGPAELQSPVGSHRGTMSVSGAGHVLHPPPAQL